MLPSHIVRGPCFPPEPSLGGGWRFSGRGHGRAGTMSHGDKTARPQSPAPPSPLLRISIPSVTETGLQFQATNPKTLTLGFWGAQSRPRPGWGDLLLSSPAKCQESCVTWASKLLLVKRVGRGLGLMSGCVLKQGDHTGLHKVCVTSGATSCQPFSSPVSFP